MNECAAPDPKPPPLPISIYRHELLWLAISLATGAIAWAWLKFHLPVPECTFHRWTSHPCVGCGSTRAARCLLAGHPLEAFRFNPLAVSVVSGIVAFDAYAVAVLTRVIPPIRRRVSPRMAQRLRFLAWTAILSNWAWVLLQGL